jgi:recombination protein RecT
MSTSIVKKIMEPAFKSQLANALPKTLGLAPDRFLRVALTALRQTPKLGLCDEPSFFGSLMTSAQLGLEVNTPLGEAYLVPYKTKCQLIIGYRGMISIARRSGQIQSISAQVVHEGDEFDFELGLNEKLRHVPKAPDGAKLTHAYAIARLVGGGVQYEVMTRAQIDAIRKRSPSCNIGPWVTDYDEMARKTACRRLFKYLPVSLELSKAIAVEDGGELEYDADVLSIDGLAVEADTAVKEQKPSRDDEYQPPLSKDHSEAMLHQIRVEKLNVSVEDIEAIANCNITGPDAHQILANARAAKQPPTIDAKDTPKDTPKADKGKNNSQPAAAASKATASSAQSSPGALFD